MRFRSATCAVALLIGLAAPATADIVDFDALPAGDNGNPLLVNGVTFTTDNGFNYIAPIGSNSLCPSITSSNPANCSRQLTVDFGQSVGSVSFGFLANNTQTIGADVGDVAIFSGATLLGTRNLIVLDGDGLSRDLVDLSSFASLTRLVITPDDFGGLLYDDFSFVAAAVPEPASWAMMIAGFALIGAAARRREGRVATA